MSTSTLIGRRNQGFVLPLTVILLVFVSIALITAGVMLARVSSRLNNYNLVSELRSIADNLVHTSVSYVAKNRINLDFSDDPWEGMDELISYVSIRGGLEGKYWEEVLESVAESAEWHILLDNEEGRDESFWEVVESFRDDAYGFDKHSFGVVVARKGSSYFFVSWAKEGAAKRYAFGMAQSSQRIVGAGLVIGSTDRVFTVPGTNQPGAGSGPPGGGPPGDGPPSGTPPTGALAWSVGDLISGDTIVFDTVTVQKGLDDLKQIFDGNLKAVKVVDIEGETNDKHDYTGFGDDDVSAEVYMNKLRDELDENSVFADYVFPVNPDSSGSVFEVYFPRKGDPKRYIEVVEKDNDGVIIGDPVEIPYTDETKTETIEIVINGKTTIKAHEEADPLFWGYVRGRYALTVYGDVEIACHLMYEDFEDKFFEKVEQEADVLVMPVTKTSMEELLGEFSSYDSEQGDYLRIAAIGGDLMVSIKGPGEAGQAQPVKILMGDFYSLPDDVESGGTMTIEGTDRNDERPSQLFVFGTLTSMTLELEDLEGFYLSVPGAGDGDDNVSSARMSLIGTRVW